MFDRIKPYLTIRSLIFCFSFIAGWPCVFYLIGWLPHYQVNYIALFLVSSLYVMRNHGKSIPDVIWRILIAQIVCWGLYSVIHNDSTYFTRIFLLIITFLILKMQYNDYDSTRFVKLYNGWLSLQVVLGSIGLILVLSGILHPFFTFKEMDLRPGYYFGMFTTNTYQLGLVRNAGYFDEPGALAFWGMYALLFNKLFVDNKKIEITLIVGLISTLSVAYFIQLSIYILVFYRKRASKLILIAVGVIIVMKFIASYNEAMDRAMFGRLEYNEDTGTISGDNRTVLIKRCWDIFTDHPVFGMGASALTSAEIGRKYGFVGANFFMNWAADGLIGVIITFLPLICLFRFGKINRIYHGVTLILFLGYIQRPYDSTQLLYPLLSYTLLIHAFMTSYKYLGSISTPYANEI